MKKGLKKIAIILLVSFSTIFIVNPVFADHRRFNNCCGTTERWGRGGKWETKNSSTSNALWPIVFGALGLGVLIYLFKNSGSKPEPQKIYIYGKNENNQEHGKKFNYNPSHEEINLSEASDEVVIMQETNKNLRNNYENNNDNSENSSLTIGDKF